MLLAGLELARAFYSRRNGGKENKDRKIVRKDLKRLAGGARLEEEEAISLESVMAEFKLSNNTLRRMMTHMSDNMDRGLQGGLNESTIAMLPSFVPELPNGTERGKFVAMDLGGTNLRVMIMEMEPGEPMRSKQFNTRMPNSAQHGTAEKLFDYIAKALADFLCEKGLENDGLMVGFTFSYPCDQTGLRSATLLRWTKGVTATGAVGEDVVRLLEEAIERDGRVKVEIVALINDTVGTMVAAAYENGGDCDLGVIIGTGTNAAYMEDTKKLVFGLSNATDEYTHKSMIVDTEWGGFGDRGEADYIFTQYDKIVDARSDHPGVNSLDKLIAGMCMGEIVRLVLEKLTNAKVLFKGLPSDRLNTIGSFPTKYISEILHDDCGSYANTRQIMDELAIESYTFSDMLLLREVCVVVSRRSANLAAAAIACVLNRVGRPKMVVGMDGSTYKYHPFFHHWVTEKIKELVQPGLECTVIQTGDGSGKGAALITAIVARLRKKKEEEERKIREKEEEEKRKKMMKEEEERKKKEDELRSKEDIIVEEKEVGDK
ncbi:hxk-2 [Pristionchus pacificus]|uniref:Phosphotransferase n=1 Tax=Pristionchus pacificus TaxID=54126 RepID=A0A2A6CGY1_PRIPA|nr:hxk-2 [Pristionchus pacificus]|eukprot:PDM77340.1 hxk-2 [Pristionchus pacificus]